MPALGTTFYLLGKFGATAAFGTTYLYTSELFPTGWGKESDILHLSGLQGPERMCGPELYVWQDWGHLISLCGKVSEFLLIKPSKPFPSLGLLTGLPWLPMAVFASLATLSGLFTLLLPETLGQPLPG